MRAAAALVLLSCTAACGPASVAEAERNCAAGLGATGPTGIARAGYTSPGGFQSSVEVDLSVAAGSGRDLSAAYDACVYRQSGELPRRRLFAR